MISLEEVRQEVIATFKTAHDIAYPSTLVNYPNFVVVDLESQKDPFVSVELELEDTPLAALGEKEILVRGALRLYFYYREGSGMSGAYNYTDFLNAQIGTELIGSIKYQAVDTLNVVTFPGWKGCMNTLVFDVVEGVTC